MRAQLLCLNAYTDSSRTLCGSAAEKARPRLVSRTIGGVASCTRVDPCLEGR